MSAVVPDRIESCPVCRKRNRVPTCAPGSTLQCGSCEAWWRLPGERPPMPTPYRLSGSVRLALVFEKVLMLAIAGLLFWGGVKIAGTFAPSPSHQRVSAVGAPSYVCEGHGGVTQAFVTMSAPGLNEYAVVCRDGVHDTASW
jgi:hypothetical protein